MTVTDSPTRVTVALTILGTLGDTIAEHAVAVLRDSTLCGVCGASLGPAGPVGLHVEYARDDTGEVAQCTATHRGCCDTRIVEVSRITATVEREYEVAAALLPVDTPGGADQRVPYLLVNPTVGPSVYTRAPGGGWTRADLSALCASGFVAYGQPLQRPATGVATATGGTLRVGTVAGDWSTPPLPEEVVSAVTDAGGVLVAALPATPVGPLTDHLRDHPTDTAAVDTALRSPGCLVGWVHTDQARVA